MGRGKLRLWGIAPTADNVELAIGAFAELGGRRVTAFDQDWLSVLRRLTIPSGIDIAEYSELVATCLALGGARSLPLADDRLLVESVRFALSEQPESSPFYRSRLHPGIARRVASVLREFRAARYHFQTIGDIDTPTQEKVAALAAIAAAVSASLERTRTEFLESRIERCLASGLPDDNGLPMLLVFVGENPSPLELDWLEWISQQGCDVVAVALWRSEPGGFEAASELAARFGVLVEPVGRAHALLDSLFTKLSVSEQRRLVIESSPDPLAECEWALRRCRQQLKAGLKPDEIGIFVRNLAEYAPLLTAAALRVGVGVSIVHQTVLAHTPMARWLLHLIASLGRDDPDTFLESIGSSYFGSTADQIEPLVSALEAQQSGGDAWDRLAAASAGHGAIGAVLDWRSEWLGKRQTLAGWQSAFESLVGSLPCSLVDEPGIGLSSPDRIALKECAASLGRRAEVDMGGLELDYSSWLESTESAWRLSEVASVPEPGGIRATSAPVGLLGVRSLHGLGFLEGVFPRRKSDDPILSDFDRASMNAHQLPQHRLKDSTRIARSERELFLLVCAASTESVELSFPAAGEERDNVPAFYLSELERATGSTVHRASRKIGDWAPPSEWDASERDQSLARALAMPAEPLFEPIVVDDEALAAVRADRAERLSLPELRDALECPFRFAFARRLRLTNTPSEEVYFDHLPKQVHLASIESPDEARARLTGAFDMLLQDSHNARRPEARKLARAAGERSIEGWVRSEWASRDAWPRTAGSSHSPAEFGGPALAGELRLDDSTTVMLRGQLDEVGSVGDLRVAKVYNARATFQLKPTSWTAAEKLEAAVIFAAMGNDLPGAAVEFVASSGERTLVLKDRIAGESPSADVKRGLRVVSLDARETRFMSEGRELLRKAYAAATESKAEALPGEYCRTCRFGDVCRRSSEFGEQQWLGGDPDGE